MHLFFISVKMHDLLLEGGGEGRGRYLDLYPALHLESGLISKCTVSGHRSVLSMTIGLLCKKELRILRINWIYFR